MLSARAGDEASVEGLGAGADDYLVKPFSARELVARVRTHLTLSRLRRRSERELAELYGLFMQVPGAITVRRGPELRCVFQNAVAVQLFDQRGKSLTEAASELPPEIAELQRAVVRSGVTQVQREAGGTPGVGGRRRRGPLLGRHLRAVAAGRRRRRRRHDPGLRGHRSRRGPPACRGRQPGQGRVPRHARPRAAQPAGAHRHRAAADEAARRRREQGAADHRAPGQPPHPAGRRSARHLADHPRPDRARAGAAGAAATSSPARSRSPAR